jgi:hypothetical protein
VGETKSSPAVQAIGLTPATRRGALLRALRTNPAILRVDPAAEERSAVFFAAWVDAGRDAASDASRRESELAADDGMLGSTLSALGACSFFWGIGIVLMLMLIFGIKCPGSYPRTCFGRGISSACIRLTKKTNSGRPFSQVKRHRLISRMPSQSPTLTVRNRSWPHGPRR